MTQGFRTPLPRLYAAGNLLRGALAAYKCYDEGLRAARSLHTDLSGKIATPVEIRTQLPDLAWIAPSLIDPAVGHPLLTRLRFTRPTRGTLLTLLNGRKVMRSRIDAQPWQTVTLPWFDQEVREGDEVRLVWE